ncbi:MAG TPA: GDSL-type esterase/lipase family protein, partial [Thermoanaerobaculia bacterium]|nr:GDSL-type esterase/lipase family protein [Thermoanaerobaculia bacterium]
MKRAVATAALALALGGCHHAKKSHAHYNARLDDGVLRVAVVGDSLAYGAGDESGQGIPGRLPEELRQHHRGSIDVQNLGLSGATTDDVHARLAEQSIRDAVYIADVVVLSVGANDAFQAGDLRGQLITHRDEFAHE